MDHDKLIGIINWDIDRIWVSLYIYKVSKVLHILVVCYYKYWILKFLSICFIIIINQLVSTGRQRLLSLRYLVFAITQQPTVRSTWFQHHWNRIIEGNISTYSLPGGRTKWEGEKRFSLSSRILKNLRFPAFLTSGVSHPPTPEVGQQWVSHTGAARRTTGLLGTCAYSTNVGRAILGDCDN